MSPFQVLGGRFDPAGFKAFDAAIRAAAKRGGKS